MESTEYKCPNCNAGLAFMPDIQKFGCEYCGSEFTLEEMQEINAENPVTSPTESEIHELHEFEEHTNLYHCASCGANIMADDEQTALFCYYCHNPIILAGKLTGKYKPDKVIGFRYTRENAVNNFRDWISKKWFVPEDFKSQEQIEKITGLYVPFWIADCKIKADLSAVGKNIRTWSDGEYQYTETKEYSIVRQADISAEGIPADGASKIEDALMEAIEPFDYKDLKDFSMSYFSGFFADKFDVDKPEVFPRIRERASQAGRKIVHDSIGGYTSVSVHSESYNIMNTKWQYVMLPVWFMTYKYNDKIYEFALNGQTGKLAGTPPLDKSKLKLFCSAVGMIVAVIAFLFGGASL
ncbi:MAG: hypothetical protein HDT23_03920 [Ruminococcus sp.]|nr:hypothetical protein [Ruminococcus sp.]